MKTRFRVSGSRALSVALLLASTLALGGPAPAQPQETFPDAFQRQQEREQQQRQEQQRLEQLRQAQERAEQQREAQQREQQQQEQQDNPQNEAERLRLEAERNAQIPNQNENIPDYGPTQTRPPAGGDLDSRIRNLGQGTQPRTPGTRIPEDAPPIGLTPPPPVIYGEELEDDIPCCGIRGNSIFYPITKDPQEVEPVQFATNDARKIAHQVTPHSGGFIESTVDLALPSPGFDMMFARTYRSDITYQSGGIVGEGWDFNWNKRIVPVYARITGNGLGVEIMGADNPALFYYDGTGHADWYPAKHSETRSVINFGDTYESQKSFQAYVTTYVSPSHEFLEIERYIVFDPADHPFKLHVDVKDELGEAIFYVVRVKDGTRYVFNCRGQLIYVFDKHHNRIELRYGGQMNPLTHSPVLTQVIDSAKPAGAQQGGRVWSLRWTTIDTASLATNFDCMFLTGTYPIPRLEEVTDPAGRKAVIHYAAGSPPRIDWVTREFPSDAGLSTQYRYSAAGLLADIILPKEFGGQKRPFVHNEYDGQGRVVRQRHGTQTYTIQHGPTVTVTDALGIRAQYVLTDLGDTKVVGSFSVTGPGGTWTRRYGHNPSHQITSETLPRGNRIEYIYDGGNDPVTLGRVRDWADRNLTYESDLSKGNLLAVRQISDRPQAQVVFRNGAAVLQTAQGAQEEIQEAFSYEQLFNEIDTFIDKRGNQTAYTFAYNRDYGHLGVPVSIQTPPATQPDGSKLTMPPQVITYSGRGEPLSITQGTRSTSNVYDVFGRLTQRTHEDGRTTITTFRADGEIASITMPEGYRIDYQRNGRGLIETSVLDPGGAAVRTRYRYDLHGNTLEERKDVRDLFTQAGAAGLGVAPLEHGENVITREYDVNDRVITETLRGFDGITTTMSFTYDAAGQKIGETSPSPSGAGPVARQFTYDARGKLTSETVGGRAKRFEYDANGNVTAEVDQLQRHTFHLYDGFDRQIATADHAGGIMRREYDKAGNAVVVSFEGETAPGGARALLLETRTEFDEYGRPIRVRRNTFVNGYETVEHSYDANHDLVREKGPGEGITQYGYDAKGRRTRREDPLGNVTRYVYSAAGYLTSIEETEQEAAFATPVGSASRAARTYTTTIVNDKFGNPISRSMRGGQISRMGYDSEGNVRVAIDETGRRTVNGYNARKQLVSVLRDGQTTRIAFNPAGMRISSSLPGGAMTWTYDQWANELTATNSVTGQVTRKTYDAANQMQTMTAASGRTYRYSYDSRGRMTGIAGLESFSYDGLGRVIATGTNERQYDGLGNVVSDRQRFVGDPSRLDVTVRSEYAADGSERILRVPAFAGAPAATYRWRLDPLGRATSVEFNGEVVARYDYSGTSRVARVSYADNTHAIYAYDAARRPNGLRVFSLIENRNLWTAAGIYHGNTLVDNREFYGAAPGDAVRSQSMTLTLDAQQRPVVRESRVILRPDPNGPYMQWVTRQFSDLDATGRPTAQVSATFVNDTLSAVRSQAFTFDRGRIAGTATRVADVQNGPGSNGFVRAAAEQRIQTPKFTENERFTYDLAGNVVHDDQFDYDYDHHDRLASAAMHFDGRRGNNESARWSYDNFGRRVSVRYGPRVAAMAPYKRQDINFIYDGDRVIAEVLVSQPASPVLLARYVHGAGPGEIVRMDRREDDDPAKPLRTFILHEGLTGGYNFVTSDDFRGPKIIGRRESLALNENLIEGTMTRVPYLSRDARFDSFTEFVLDETRKTYTYDYTRAPVIAWRENQEQWLAQVRAATSELQSATLKLMAIPLLPLAPALPAAAWVGGGLSVGLDYSMTSYVGGEYSVDQGMKAFALGAIGGGFGAAFGSMSGVSAATRLGVEAGFEVGTGTLIDMASSGEAFSEAFFRNLLLSSVGAVGGKVQAAAAARYGDAPVLGANVLKPISRGIGTVARVISGDIRYASNGPVHKLQMVVNASSYTDAERLTILNKVLAELSNSTKASRMLGNFIRAKKLHLAMAEFVDNSGARGCFVANGGVIYLNETFFKSHYGNLLTSQEAITDIAGTIVHEGIHFLGGGEIAAHIAQGAFWSIRMQMNPKLKLASEVKWWEDPNVLARAATMSDMTLMLEILNMRGYVHGGAKPLYHDFVNSTPLNAAISKGGFEKLLGISQSNLVKLKHNLPGGHSI